MLIKNSESTISTILLCNNVVNILSSAIATGVLIKVFGDAGVVYATFIMTVLILIFGEALALYGLIVSLILTSQ
jgi:Mg2+/Co2+ transporter CorB